jgi:uncharacterized protein
MNPLIHKYQFNGMNIVLDVNSGTVHIFDDLSYEMLDLTDYSGLIGRYGREPVEEAAEEIDRLIADGVLFSADQFAGRTDFNTGNGPIKAMCLPTALRQKAITAGNA